ncbi:protein TolQ [Taylorella equigenitalis]|uniref:MotA/TolQ/ExbB proton channel family protein n=2 Tax=Taylorella equigenitalis TaxID=29575 RepID=A0A654KHR2_TAYEM|nr:protein TolQ [Taylorella equigenitalis]ADU91915.1 MotA/TolQ/ExbB proton channel family protein [Taylorella equigenitalis MCE9]AFN35478.1 putative import protein [Taylorella equigenitalis ATCC 35865]ASY38907.1 protein TolQ [Taylorella equigenitalis]ASY41861.1 protein TolQ [Taylorella equigenitalis]WDU49724.1 protein TolQ [Taylorella equigenitalis]
MNEVAINTPDKMSILTLITDASLPVQIIMLLLLVLSVVSWAIIFSKFTLLLGSNTSNKNFLNDFWRGGDLTDLHSKIQKAPRKYGITARVFEAGMTEFLKARSKKLSPELQTLAADRAMQATYNREMDGLDSRLSFLATVGSVSPYIGLLGTVWGIMHSFLGLTADTTATLSAVAPGIAEALIATAIGLFAAIPASIAYNSFSRSIDKVSTNTEGFMDEFLNILQRQAS